MTRIATLVTVVACTWESAACGCAAPAVARETTIDVRALPELADGQWIETHSGFETSLGACEDADGARAEQVATKHAAEGACTDTATTGWRLESVVQTDVAGSCVTEVEVSWVCGA